MKRILFFVCLIFFLLIRQETLCFATLSQDCRTNIEVLAKTNKSIIPNITADKNKDIICYSNAELAYLQELQTNALESTFLTCIGLELIRVQESDEYKTGLIKNFNVTKFSKEVKNEAEQYYKSLMNSY